MATVPQGVFPTYFPRRETSAGPDLEPGQQAGPSSSTVGRHSSTIRASAFGSSSRDRIGTVSRDFPDEHVVLRPGDTISCACGTPHRLSNQSADVTVGTWVIVHPTG